MGAETSCKVWIGTSNDAEQCSVAILAADALYAAQPPPRERDTVEARLAAGESPAEVLEDNSHTISLSLIQQLEMIKDSNELCIVYVKGSDNAQVVVAFADELKAEEAFAALRDRLGTGWQSVNERQSIWKAIVGPAKFLFLTVVLPALVVLTGMLGGEISATSKEDMFGCLVAFVVIGLVVVGVLFLGAAWMIGIGAALVLTWLGWVTVCVVRRPDVVRLVRG
jgi:hypothetical protein